MEQLFDTRVPDSSYAETWSFLEPRLEFVLKNTEKGLSYAHYMSIYTAIYNYCLKTSRDSSSQHDSENDVQDPLYRRLQSFLKDHVDSLRYTENDTLNEGLLIHYKNNWDKFTMAAKTIHNMFGYMNKQISRKGGSSSNFDVYTLALNCWKENIFSLSSIYLTKTMLQMIEKQRNGEMIDHNLIKITLDSYVTLGFEVSTKVDATLNIYKDHFQNDFLEQTKQYYSHHAKAYLSDHTIPEYVDHALKCIKEENDRLTSYLHISSTTPLIDVCHKELIKNYAPIIQEEFQTLLDNERRPDMSKVIQLLNMIPEGTNPLKIKFEQHVKTYGLQSIEQLVNNTKESVDSKDYIDCLLVTQKKFSQLVNEAFINDPGFIASLDKACSELVNRNKLTQKEGVTKSSELLARYCDAALRKGSKLTEETDLEQLLKDAMTIFRYIEDQDVFQKFYSKMLAKRLVNGTSSSEDGEINMLSKLKDSCGQEYTYKLTKMFNDIGSSKELNETFFNQVSNQDIKDSDIDFYTMVISFASWPLSSTATKFTLPPGLTTYYERFQRFYIHQHNGRKLNWLYHLCKGEIKAQYAHSKIPYTFIVSTYQMAILILFNDNDTISYESLCERTQLEEDIINGQLGILLKAKILLLSQGSKVGEANSVYKFNPDFKSKKIRVNLNLPVKSEVKQEAEETHQSINEDRKLYIQAAIVRVMKMRKTLLYVKLVQEVLAQISSHFKPQVVDIKKGIDILIEKEYIERDTEDKHTLKYLA